LLWYLPVAHFDHANLDGPMLALPDLDVRDGVWDETSFDRALFEQVPRVPASFRVELPAAIMRSPADAIIDDALTARAHLGSALTTAIDRLRPAGVAGAVELRP